MSDRLTLSHLQVRVGAKVLVHDVSLHLEPERKVVLVLADAWHLLMHGAENRDRRFDVPLRQLTAAHVEVSLVEARVIGIGVFKVVVRRAIVFACVLRKERQPVEEEIHRVFWGLCQDALHLVAGLAIGSLEVEGSRVEILVVQIQLSSSFVRMVCCTSLADALSEMYNSKLDSKLESGSESSENRP